MKRFDIVSSEALVSVKIDLRCGADYSVRAFPEAISRHTKTMSEFESIRRQLAKRLTPLSELRITPERIRQAAVTLILREHQGKTETLIIKRADHENDPWSGHLALPGGRAEAQDDDLLITAARETREEIGIELLENDGSRNRFLGQLPLLAPGNPVLPRLEITPLVAIAPLEFNIILNHEIASAFWVSVAELKRDGRSGEHRMQFGEIIKKWPAYPTEGGLIWGITERILTDFLQLLD